MRFTRDKRGYETTFLVHAVRRDGRSRERILYWFRTPPGVRVGRPALDEDAIRWIEDQNPDIEFDWPKILEAKAPPAPPSDDVRARRGRRDKNERRRQPAAQKPASPRREPSEPDPAQAASVEREPLEPEPLEPEPLEPEPLELEPHLEPEPLEPLEPASLEPFEPSGSSNDEDLVEAFEQLTHPDAEETVEPPPTPLEQSFGPEQLTRLRARYAELQARINERGGDPDRILALRAQAEQFNPDVWVTEEEIRKGVESFEPKIRELRAALGLRRRRRSRRGGRRRHAARPDAPPPAEPE